MAKDVKKEEKTTPPVEPTKLYTEEEYERLAREKFKTRLNQISRVFGIITILLLIYVAVFDPLFEGSFFGALFCNEEYHAYWNVMSAQDGIGPGFKIWDDPLQFYITWVPALGYTLVLIAVATFAGYLITYSVADLIGFFKQIFISIHDAGKDLKSGLVEGVNKEIGPVKAKKKRKPLFGRKNDDETDPTTEDNETKTETKKPEKKRRREKELGLDEDQPEYTSDQLDILLAGGTLPEDTQENGEKPLF